MKFCVFCCFGTCAVVAHTRDLQVTTARMTIVSAKNGKRESCTSTPRHDPRRRHGQPHLTASAILAAMQSAPRLSVPAPSSALLRFLRSHSEAAGFFTANARRGGFPDGHAPHAAHGLACGPRAGDARRDSARGLATAALRPARVEASFLNLDFVWPRSSGIAPAPALPSPHPRYTGSAAPPARQRRASSSHEPWLRRIWHMGRERRGEAAGRRAPPLGSFLDDGSENSMLGLGRSIAAKAGNEMRLRCTEFDECGKVTLVNGEFKKTELIAKVGLWVGSRRRR